MINVEPQMSSQIREGKAFDVSRIPNREEYIARAQKMLDEGRVAFLLLFGGMATRLGLGSMYVLDPVEIAKYLLGFETRFSKKRKRISTKSLTSSSQMTARSRTRHRSPQPGRHTWIRSARSMKIRGCIRGLSMGERQNAAFEEAYETLFPGAIKNVRSIVVPNSTIQQEVIKDYQAN